MSLLLICGVDQTHVWWSVESWKETAAEAKQSKGTNVEGQAYRRRQLIHDATKAAYSMLRALNCVRVTNMRMTQQLSTSAPQVGPGGLLRGLQSQPSKGQARSHKSPSQSICTLPHSPQTHVRPHNTTQRITALINAPPEDQMCWCSCCACVPDHSKVHSCFGVVTCSEYRAAYSDVGAAHLDLHSSTARRQQARQQQSNTNISKRNC